MKAKNIKKNNIPLKTVSLAVIFVFIGISGVSGQVMQSSQYKMESDSVNFGGIRSSTGSFIMQDTFGEVATGRTNGTVYYMRAGYQERVDSQAGSEEEQEEEESVEQTSTAVSVSGNGPVIFLQRFDIRGLAVSFEGNSAIISWTTTEDAKSSLIWGESREAPSEQLSSDIFSKKHQFILRNLQAGKAYIWNAESQDGFGNKAGILNQTISLPEQTEGYGPGPGIQEIQNARNLNASVRGGSIVLSWENPESFVSVRIVRSEDFYPEDPYHGEIIYEGTGNEFTDLDVGKEKIYYYSVFSRSVHGEFSSGASINIKMTKNGILEVNKTDPFSLIPQSQNVHEEIKDFDIRDMQFAQNGRKIKFDAHGVVKIDNMYPFKIIIPYKKLPEVLKTIAITMKDIQTEETFTFLLKVNKKMSAYEAEIGSLERSGEFSVTISILDYSAQGIRQFHGTLLASPLWAKTPLEKFVMYAGLALFILASWTVAEKRTYRKRVTL